MDGPYRRKLGRGAHAGFASEQNALPDVLFKNFIPSGFALLAANGLTQLLAALMLFKNHPWAYWAVLVCGVILMLWIVLEWYVWGFVALSNIFFVLGLVEVIGAVCCIRRSC